MGNRPQVERSARLVARTRRRSMLPKPTPEFRRRAWREFQRALDPLAPIKPLRALRRH